MIFPGKYHTEHGTLGEKKLYIKTFGCQMNVHDSDQLAKLLEDYGYSRTDRADHADLIIVNTCSIRRKAAEKVYSELGRYQQLKKKNPRLILGMGGCVAQQWGRAIFKKLPHLDMVFGTRNIHQLPALLSAVEKGDAPVAEISVAETIPSMGIVAPPPAGTVTAYVTIMQGCDNFCSFCVVPYLRGREESRGIDEISDEIRTLADRGVKEVVLLGQNVNSYGRKGGNGSNFPALIRKVAKIDGIERIRFTTSHPKDLSPALIDCFAEVEKLCSHIHLPVQSGSNRILERMNRGYTRDVYMARVEALRKACPSIGITSDVIVGFPGEDDDDFAATISLMEEVRFDGLFSFRYSEREGTAAASYPEKVAEPVKRERLQRLQHLQDEHTLARNRALVGCTEEVLVEGRSKNAVCDMSGRTRSFKIVNFRGGTDISGKTVPVRITAAYLHSLRGELEEKEDQGCR